jgi:hypothetical protein
MAAQLGGEVDRSRPAEQPMTRRVPSDAGSKAFA